MLQNQSSGSLADLLSVFQNSLHNLIECNAFELQMHTGEHGRVDCYIPYMMNDALECYFVLKDCQMTGTYDAASMANAGLGDSDAFGNFAPSRRSEVELLQTENSPALILRQTNGNVATLWFKNIEKTMNCYRYHEIGHFWVKGQEQWRQIVYIIGTIYDKFEYLGGYICNKEELELLPLMEFAPFRYWSPIHESLDEHYPDTIEGIEVFRGLCTRAGDYRLSELAKHYEKKFFRAMRLAKSSGFLGALYHKFIFSRFAHRIAIELSSSGHEALYEIIYQCVCEASSKYPSRDYGEHMNKIIVAKRNRITTQLYNSGYSGTYPRFSKGNTSILVTEEHPFTLSALEYENYGFRQQLMVSETLDEARFLNQGFFEGNGNRGWIAKSIDEFL